MRSHDDIAFRKGRANVGKILVHVGLIPNGTNDDLRTAVDHAIADKNGRFGRQSFAVNGADERRHKGQCPLESWADIARTFDLHVLRAQQTSPSAVRVKSTRYTYA